MAAQNNRKNSKRKNKIMSTSKTQTYSSNRGAVKSTSADAASIAPAKPTRQEATPPSDADIATKAYEIWLARGQEMGNDQQHWFEAKRQLRQR